MPTSRPRPPGLVDVASLAGVSYQTVSRVINGHASVADATRRKVLGAIAELDYHPNGAARTLRTGRSSTLAVFASNTRLYGFTEMLGGIEEAGRQAGLSVSIAALNVEGPGAVEQIARHALTQPLAGVIALTHDDAGARALALVPDALPAVAMGGSGSVPGGRPRVSLDERAGAAAATDFLLGLGHETVHHVAVPGQDGPDDRISGWREALLRAGRPVPEPLRATWRARSGYEAGLSLAAQAGVTAVLCGNDELAVGVVRALHDGGRRVPGDVSVVGFDDQPFAEFLRPALTTVRQCFEDLGRDAVALLLDRMQSGRAGSVPAALGGVELVVRESTAAPRSGRP